MAKNKHDMIKYVLIEHRYNLDKFVKDKDSSIRAAVAKQGYGLDKLVNDEHQYVRYCALDAILDSKE